MLHNQSGQEESEALGAGASGPAAEDAAETTFAEAAAQVDGAEASNREPANEAPPEEPANAVVEPPEAAAEEPAAEVADDEPGEAVPEPEAAPEAEPEQSAAEAVPEQPAAEAAADEPADAEPATEAQAAEAAAEAPAPESAAAESASGLKRGDLVEGTILETTPTSVKVQLGEHGEGLVPGSELERMGRKALEALKPGAPLTVFIVNPHAKEGGALVSINRAEEELDWKKAEAFKDNQEVYDTRIAGYNKGGLIVKFGRLRGFVPQSQMNAERRRMDENETPETRWGKMVNEPIVVKVMEVDRSRNRLILSERSAARESREKRKETLINQLTVGETRAGRVVSLEDFGAFIDIGGAEGLVHLTELSWHHVTHPRQFLQIGQSVSVRVISVDPNAKRIGLSMKQLEMDPWDRVATEYNTGQLVKAKVTKLTKFGAFAEIEGLPEIEGLIHISELSDRRVMHPKEVVNEGDELTLRIVKMDIQNRRLGLSLKKVNSPEYLDSDWGNE